MAKKEDKESKEAGKELQVQPARSQWLGPFEEVEHLFDEFLSRGGWMQPLLRRGFPDLEAAFGARWPKLDIIDRDDEVIVKAELPGVDKENVDVSVSENMLSIRAHSQHEKKEEKGQYFRRELSRGECQRTVRLPGQVDGDKAKASFKDGILEISVPKLPGSKRQSIKVE
jgi:HSP20 family protein